MPNPGIKGFSLLSGLGFGFYLINQVKVRGCLDWEIDIFDRNKFIFQIKVFRKKPTN